MFFSPMDHGSGSNWDLDLHNVVVLAVFTSDGIADGEVSYAQASGIWRSRSMLAQLRQFLQVSETRLTLNGLLSSSVNLDPW